MAFQTNIGIIDNFKKKGFFSFELHILDRWIFVKRYFSGNKKTISDAVERAGVSVATLDKVLNESE